MARQNNKRKHIGISGEAWSALNQIQGYLQLKTKRKFSISGTILFLSDRLQAKLKK